MLALGPISDQVKLLQAAAKMALDKSAVQTADASTVSAEGKDHAASNFQAVTLTSKDGVVCSPQSAAAVHEKHAARPPKDPIVRTKASGQKFAAVKTRNVKKLQSETTHEHQRNTRSDLLIVPQRTTDATPSPPPLVFTCDQHGKSTKRVIVAQQGSTLDGGLVFSGSMANSKGT